MLALHLLQNCLVYVNTLMLQRVLTEPAWLARMTTEDHRRLTPAVHAHINPYGHLDADLSRRINLDLPGSSPGCMLVGLKCWTRRCCPA